MGFTDFADDNILYAGSLDTNFDFVTVQEVTNNNVAASEFGTSGTSYENVTAGSFDISTSSSGLLYGFKIGFQSKISGNNRNVEASLQVSGASTGNFYAQSFETRMRTDEGTWSDNVWPHYSPVWVTSEPSNNSLFGLNASTSYATYNMSFFCPLKLQDTSVHVQFRIRSSNADAVAYIKDIDVETYIVDRVRQT